MSAPSAAPRNPYGASPLRRPGSIRRTSSIDTSWPQGAGGPMHLQGHARDAITTDANTPPHIVAEDRVDVLASPVREILEISVHPARSDVSGLVSKRAGGHLRAAINDLLPQERDAGTPQYLLLDDLAGASLVAGWAWSRWREDWMNRARTSGAQSTAGRNGNMVGVCTGFAPGSSALLPDGSSSGQQSSCPVPPLQNPDDIAGWHELPSQQGVGMRRARRIDIWKDGDLIMIDAGFQDSATAPEGGRVAVHEYNLTATADARTLRLLEIHADPRILPYPECPGAAANTDRILGQNLPDLRRSVLHTLAGTLGCTHLNDALRALAEVPQLIVALGD